MRILLVDDDATLTEAIAFKLKEEGYDVITAEDGVKAIDIIQNQEPLDLIISDVMMPNISGLGLLGLLKQFYLEQVPVIFISTLDKGEIVLSAMRMGAKDFIIKPINFDELLIRVKKYLNKEMAENPI